MVKPLDNINCVEGHVDALATSKKDGICVGAGSEFHGKAYPTSTQQQTIENIKKFARFVMVLFLHYSY